MQHLYRHFDKEGTLLYVGVSLSAVKRLGEHKQNARWFDLISRIEMEPFETRKEVLEAERIAILTENPKYNLRVPVISEVKVNTLKGVPRALPNSSEFVRRTDLIHKVIKHFGSQRALAKAISVSDGAVSHWLKLGCVPPMSALRIEIETQGLANGVDLIEWAQAESLC